MAGSILIKDTAREERAKIVADSLGYSDVGCDDWGSGISDMYQDYIDGKKELRQINEEYRARFVLGGDGPDRMGCGMV